MIKDIKAEYDRWLENVTEEDLLTELKEMDEAAMEDAFYRTLSFGTGGLRGVLGAGTNRMNVHTVAKASQGLANYVKAHSDRPGIAVSFDSRRGSEMFAQTASRVFAANGIKVWLYSRLMPTPCLSYAVRKLNCSAGVMVTASHNPAKYNGYKVYGADGCQITTEAADKILKEIEALDLFRDVRTLSLKEALDQGKIEYIPEEVYTDFTEEVKKQSVLYGDEIDRNVAVVYTPLNGTGLKPVTRVLSESGFTNINVVKEQEEPDGNFPTCPYPNPEIREAMELGLSYCEKTGADLLLATDPDCDRCGIAVKGEDGYRLLTGNETGLLLLDFIGSQRSRHQKMPSRPVFVKTIVTMDLAEKIASHYGMETINVLTGFKFIGEVIGRLEKEGRAEDYVCGFEESYGYLTGTYVRDKDAVNAALMICEMFAYYKSRGLGLLEKLEELYRTYGYCMNTLHSYEFEGSAGMIKMKEIMEHFRNGLASIDGSPVKESFDFSKGLFGLPESDVLKFVLADGCSVVLRPSGTEPKLKCYISVVSSDREKAEEREKSIAAAIEKRMMG